jgi:hypothetical protein
MSHDSRTDAPANRGARGVLFRRAVRVLSAIAAVAVVLGVFGAPDTADALVREWARSEPRQRQNVAERIVESGAFVEMPEPDLITRLGPPSQTGADADFEIVQYEVGPNVMGFGMLLDFEIRGGRVAAARLWSR